MTQALIHAHSQLHPAPLACARRGLTAPRTEYSMRPQTEARPASPRPTQPSHPHPSPVFFIQAISMLDTERDALVSEVDHKSEEEQVLRVSLSHAVQAAGSRDAREAVLVQEVGHNATLRAQVPRGVASPPHPPALLPHPPPRASLPRSRPPCPLPPPTPEPPKYWSPTLGACDFGHAHTAAAAGGHASLPSRLFRLSARGVGPCLSCGASHV